MDFRHRISNLPPQNDHDTRTTVRPNARETRAHASSISIQKLNHTPIS